MAYTTSWDDAIPAGGSSANTVDDNIRRLRQEIHERMDDALFDDWTADPLVLKAGIGGGVVGGAKVGKRLLIGFSDFINLSLDSSAEHYGRVAAGVEASCPLILPEGVTLQAIEVFYDIGTVGDVTLELRKRAVTDVTLAGTTIVASDSAPGTALGLSALAEVVDGESFYHLVLESSGGVGFWSLFGVRITYDAPDATATY